MRSFSVSVVLALVTFSACTCSEGAGTQKSDAAPQAERLVVDFGKTRVAETARLEIALFNHGRSTLRIESVDRAGLPLAFRLAQPEAEIAPNASTRLRFSFSPEEIGVQSGTLTLKTNSRETPTVTFTLRGEGVTTAVKITPEVLTFPTIEVGSRSTLPILLENEGSVGEDVELSALAEGSPHFIVGPVPGDNNIIHLDPGAKVELPVAFEPKFPDPAGFVSTVDFVPCPTCTTVTVTLRGTGIDSFLAISPRDCLDFGLLNPGTSKTKSFAISNLGTKSLAVLDAAVTTGAEHFSIATTMLPTVEGGGSADLQVTYTADAVGADAGQVSLRTDNARSPQVVLCVKGASGGPNIAANPSSVSFGIVAAGTPRHRMVRVSNIGTAQAGVAPLVISKVSIANGTGEFSVPFPSSVSLKAGESTTLDVKYDPVDDGTDNAILAIESNDPDTAVLQVPLTGNGRKLPACQLTLVPGTTLDFGNLEAGRTATLALSLQNKGATDCVIDSLKLGANTDGAFSLVSGPVDELVLTGGASLTALVKFAPTQAKSHKGSVTFNVSDPAAPNRVVNLLGLSQKGCLLIAPDAVDFGAVQAGCASATRSITLYNTCSGSVSLKSLNLVQEAVPAFGVVAPPTLPKTITSASPLTLRARYVPTDLGDDFGGLYVETDERPQPYLVPFTGKASLGGAVQEDQFKQDERPRVDILFVLDNSGSMSDEQAALGANFDAFIAYANQAGIDYHIAVTSTDTTGTGEQGRFVPLDGSRPRVLTPSTPNVRAVFQQNVALGTSGSATETPLEAMYMALSPTNLAGHNAGFLRDDAILSVIIITDEKDSSPNSMTFYQSAVIAVKGAQRAGMVSVSSVCDINPGSSQYDDRFINLASATGGITSSIATTDWGADLQRLGLFAFGRKTRFFLTTTPTSPNDVSVLIDNVIVDPVRHSPSQGDLTIWKYEGTSNSVDFNPVAVPEPGSTLTVRYPVACIAP